VRGGRVRLVRPGRHGAVPGRRRRGRPRGDARTGRGTVRSPAGTRWGTTRPVPGRAVRASGAEDVNDEAGRVVFRPLVRPRRHDDGVSAALSAPRFALLPIRRRTALERPGEYSGKGALLICRRQL
jgi:hypothetical protein